MTPAPANIFFSASGSAACRSPLGVDARGDEQAIEAAGDRARHVGADRVADREHTSGGQPVCRRQRSLLMRALSLIEHGDAVDLDIDTGSVQHAAETSSRYFLAAKVLAKGFIEAREIGHVP